MGMYTGLRARLIIKEEFWPVVTMLNLSTHSRSWKSVASAFPQYPFLRNWAEVWQSDFIPFGALSYVPWSRDDPAWQRSFKDGLWVFQCALKNHEGEIEFFVETVLPHITHARVELYSLYEENDEPEQLFIPEVGDEG